MKHGKTEPTNANQPYLSYANIQTSGTNGGSSVSGSWNTLTLNTELHDTHNLGTLSGNQITLQPGSYRFSGRGSLYASDRCQVRLYNVTDAGSVGNQTVLNAFSNAGTYNYAIAECFGRFTITTTKVFRLEYRCETSQATVGLGVATSWGNECYSSLELWRDAA